MGKLKTILFVDDEVMLTELAECFFEDHDDYDIVVFNDPESSLDYFKNNHNSIDYVVCDHQLGELSGLELTEKFIAINERADYYLITGNFASDISSSEKQIFKEILIKPFSFTELCSLFDNKLA